MSGRGKSRRWLGILAAGVVLAGGGSVASASAPRVLENAFGTMVIGDISGLIDRVGELASKINPMLNAQMLRAQVGGMIGDPNLAGFPKGKGLVVVVPASVTPYVLLEVASTRQDDVKKIIEEQTHGTVEKVRDGLLVIGRTTATVRQANTPQGKAAAALLDGDGEGNIRVTANVKRFCEVLHPEEILDHYLQSGAKEKESAIFMAQMNLAVLKRVDVAQLNIDISGDGIRLDQAIYPKGGMSTVPLSAITKAADLDKLLPAGKTARLLVNWDIPGFSKTVFEVVNEAAVAAKVSPDKMKSINETLKKWKTSYDGSFAMEMGVLENGCKTGLAWGVKDPAKALDVLENNFSILSLSKKWKKTSSYAFVPNVRTVKGIPIGRYKKHSEFPYDMDEKYKKAFEPYENRKFDVAVVGNKLLTGEGDGAIEDLITAAKSGSNPESKPLESVTKLPKGGFLYMDFELGNFVDIVILRGSGKPGKNAISSTLLLAGYKKPDCYKFTLRIPKDCMADMMK